MFGESPNYVCKVKILTEKYTLIAPTLRQSGRVQYLVAPTLLSEYHDIIHRVSQLSMPYTMTRADT